MSRGWGQAQAALVVAWRGCAQTGAAQRRTKLRPALRTQREPTRSWRASLKRHSLLPVSRLASVWLSCGPQRRVEVPSQTQLTAHSYRRSVLCHADSPPTWRAAQWGGTAAPHRRRQRRRRLQQQVRCQPPRRPPAPRHPPGPGRLPVVGGPVGARLDPFGDGALQWTRHRWCALQAARLMLACVSCHTSHSLSSSLTTPAWLRGSRCERPQPRRPAGSSSPTPHRSPSACWCCSTRATHWTPGQAPGQHRHCQLASRPPPTAGGAPPPHSGAPWSHARLQPHQTWRSRAARRMNQRAAASLAPAIGWQARRAAWLSPRRR